MGVSTGALVDATWERIEPLAAALLERETVEGQDVVRLLMAGRGILASKRPLLVSP